MSNQLDTVTGLTNMAWIETGGCSLALPVCYPIVLLNLIAFSMNPINIINHNEM